MFDAAMVLLQNTVVKCYRYIGRRFGAVYRIAYLFVGWRTGIMAQGNIERACRYRSGGPLALQTQGHLIFIPAQAINNKAAGGG